jgi:hypothetical protein
MRLFVGDDWAEDHHDVEVMDETGTVLAKKRLPEGVAGIAQLHGLIGGLLAEDPDGARVSVGIETDRRRLPGCPGEPAAGSPVPVPARGVRGQERRGRRSRARRHGPDRFPPAAPGGNSPEAEGIKILARTLKTMIWERTREVQRLRHQLREYFPPRWRPSRTWMPPTLWNCPARRPSRPGRRG